MNILRMNILLIKFFITALNSNISRNSRIWQKPCQVILPWCCSMFFLKSFWQMLCVQANQEEINHRAVDLDFFQSMCYFLQDELSYLARTYVMLYTIWYHFHNYKTSACNFSKSNIPPWVFFKFLKLYKWYQIAQRINCEVLR